MQAPPRQILLPSDREVRLSTISAYFNFNAQQQNLTNEWSGGRLHALKRLENIKPDAYARNRNFLKGDVTKLSPYLRHGCLSLNEAAQSVQTRFAKSAEKLLFEFAWRDYWRQVWYCQGDHILSDMQPPKVAIGQALMPEDVMKAQTGLPCIDAFVQDLVTIGYVHNHARMWFASYLVHWRKVDWRVAADWYEAHLLDGDTASNHLSWQWVASTFSGKPYYFNQENLAKYSGNQYCSSCQAACPFNASYEALAERLFKPTSAPAKIYTINPLPLVNHVQGCNQIVLVHDEMLSPNHTLNLHSAKKVFVFDPILHGDWSLLRLQFVADCLAELEEVEVWQGDTRHVLNLLEVSHVITQQTPNPTIKALLAGFSVDYQPENMLTDVVLTPNDLKSFSKYWQKVGPLVFR